MDIATLLIGGVLVVLGLYGSIQELGRTDDKQFGKEATKKMFTSLMITVWGLSFIVLGLVLKAYFN